MIDHLRRVVGVVLAAAVLLIAPQVAQASFGGSASRSMQVATASLTTPTAVAGNYQCTGSALARGLRVNLTGFDDADLDDTEYVYTLFRGSTAVDTVTSKSKTVALNASNQLFGSASFRIAIQPRLGNWSATPSSTPINC